MTDRTSQRTWYLSSILILATLLIWKVTLSTVLAYGHYAPPDFRSDFLRGREAYFWNGYHVAFYIHLFSGPITLLLGTLLVSTRCRRAAPSWHRRLGRVQGVLVLALLVPSGLWMAGYATGGLPATMGLGLLAIATAITIVCGWRSAAQRRLATHQRWMWRTFILLCSAVVLRVIGGAATVAQLDALWLYPVSVWASWLVPLVIFETHLRVQPALAGSVS
jgi:hypothetical protein